VILIDAVIFDLDGTLWDSCASVTASWNETLTREYGGRPRLTEEDIRGIMGMTKQQIADTLFSSYGNQSLAVCTTCIREECVYLSTHGGHLYPGVEALFKALEQDMGLYIVSNCECGYIECFLSCSGLGPYISDHVCSGATGLSKAENLRLIARRNRLHRPIYVGDTRLDEQSAREAGLPFVHAAYGFGRALAPAAVIHQPLELTATIERLNGEHHV